MSLISDLNVTRHFRYTQADLDSAIAWLQSPSIKEKWEYVANFCIIRDGGGKMECVNRPCHASISHPTLNDRTLVATECGWRRKATPHPVEFFQPFFDWLTKDSAYSPFIIWSDIHHGFVVTADMYTPMMQNIMIISRHFYERESSCFEAFNKMVSRGINGSVAYVIAFNGTIRNGLADSKFISYRSHTVSDVYSLKALRNFILGDVLGVDIDNVSLHYRANPSYYGGISLFWPKYVANGGMREAELKEDCMKLPEFREALSMFRKGKVTAAYAPPNPFATNTSPAATLAPTDITNEEAVEVLAPFVNDLLTKEGIIKSGQ